MRIRGRLPKLPIPTAAFLAAGTALCFVVLVAFSFNAPPIAASDDAAAIRRLIGATWDKPDAKVVSEPVVVEGDHAIASWTQSAHGGRALLKRSDNGWRVVLCSGDPLKSAANIAAAGVPASIAEMLAHRLAAAEANVAADRRALFSTFEGLVRMDEPASDQPHNQDHAP